MLNLLRQTPARDFKLAEIKPIHGLKRMLAVSLLLRCPHCVAGPLYAGLYALHRRCEICGAAFERDGGEWTGALWLAQWFGLAVALSVWVVLHFQGYEIPAWPLVLGSFMIVTILATYRYIKAWWIWFMYQMGYVYPEPVSEEDRRAG